MSQGGGSELASEGPSENQCRCTARQEEMRRSAGRGWRRVTRGQRPKGTVQSGRPTNDTHYLY